MANPSRRDLISHGISLPFRTQRYEGSLGDALQNAMTLTGEGNQVQAATCLEYMRQTWPQTGPRLLKFLGELYDGDVRARTMHQGLFRSLNQACNPLTSLTLDNMTTGRRSSGMRMIAHYQGSYLTVLACGDTFSVAELGAQLAWLGGALRASPSQTISSSCVPYTLIFPEKHAEDLGRPVIGCFIDYRNVVQHAISVDRNQPSGSCWRSLFRNPAIVKGFPIPRRSRSNSGMQTSIGGMAALIKARRIVTFAGTTFIKGFSAMLAAVDADANTVYWHLFFNEDGHYISYEDPRVPRVSPAASNTANIDVDDPKTQHILGWCVAIKNYTGLSPPNST